MCYLFPYIEQVNLNSEINYNYGLGGTFNGNWQTINYAAYSTPVAVYNCPSQTVGTFLYVTGMDGIFAFQLRGLFQPQRHYGSSDCASYEDTCNTNPADNPYGVANPVPAVFNFNLTHTLADITEEHPTP